MPRTLLLCFVHGFKGSDNTFREFPKDLQRAVTKQLLDHHVESVLYPKYETKGELSQATEAFLEWLKERVIEVRKAKLEKPWPPNDRNVGVILVAHSMGGFVAADALFLTLKERAHSNPSEDGPIFPLIQGILTFDTPYNGLARSMFVYGAFSNYQKVNSVFNVMTALSAAAPASLARLGSQRATTSAIASSTCNPGWKRWQVVAVRTGTVGAIAAGGVSAYVNREAIMKGIKNINKESVKEGYRQSIDALGQGLAYINRGNVGKSFAWLSDHFTFIGALLKQKELNRRLERMGALKGVGVHDFYCSLGENGYWQGGYFVPERTFCAVPEKSHAAYPLFSRQVMPKFDDEVQAHMNMFLPEKHEGYEEMTAEAADLVAEWFRSEAEAVDDPKFREPPPEEAVEDRDVDEALEESTIEEVGKTERTDEKDASNTADELPDVSPIDIAAAASLVPLPEDGEGSLVGDVSAENVDSEQNRTYMQHLFQIAQRTRTGVRGWWPSKMPNMPNMSSMPNMPDMPSMRTMLTMPNMPKVVPTFGIIAPTGGHAERESLRTADASAGADEEG